MNETLIQKAISACWLVSRNLTFNYSGNAYLVRAIGTYDSEWWYVLCGCGVGLQIYGMIHKVWGHHVHMRAPQISLISQGNVHGKSHASFQMQTSSFPEGESDWKVDLTRIHFWLTSLTDPLAGTRSVPPFLSLPPATPYHPPSFAPPPPPLYIFFERKTNWALAGAPSPSEKA